MAALSLISGRVADNCGSPSYVDLDGFDLGVHYGLARKRLSTLVLDVEDPASASGSRMPRWSVHDVLAHLDGGRGRRLAGGSRVRRPTRRLPPRSPGAGTCRRRRCSRSGRRWRRIREAAARGEGLAGIPGCARARARHEGRVTRPGGRDSTRSGSRASGSCRFGTGRTVQVNVGGARTSAWNETETDRGLFRQRRDLDSRPHRSRLQVPPRSTQPGAAAWMDWNGDPTPVIDALTIFGPEPYESSSSCSVSID